MELRPNSKYRVSGGRNDRQWYCMGRGETLREAIDEAMKGNINASN